MQRHFAKFLVLTTVAVMAFGLLSMSIAMSMGMGHCPVMRTTAACPSHSEGALFFNHHVEGFQSMMLTTTAIATVIFLIIFAYFRVGAMDVAPALLRFREEWPFAHGPPSPMETILSWLSLHNKVSIPVRI